MKTVFVLIGPKGSGKSYIGRLLEEHLSIPFLAIEPIFLRIKGERDNRDSDFIKEGYARVEEAIDSHMKHHDRILFEATGTTDYFNHLLERLESRYAVKPSRIHAPLELCFQRVRQRDASIHLPISEELIHQVNRLSQAAVFDYVLSIDNETSSDAEIINAVKGIL
ncbi:MAG: ATP-binding protein [bacterium]|nr:ATP-binding protein [bacterium]